MIALSVLALLLSIAAYVYLRQVVKQAVVEPVVNGKFPVKLFSEKRRYQVLWEEWKFIIGLLSGLAAGGWLL